MNPDEIKSYEDLQRFIEIEICGERKPILIPTPIRYNRVHPNSPMSIQLLQLNNNVALKPIVTQLQPISKNTTNINIVPPHLQHSVQSNLATNGAPVIPYYFIPPLQMPPIPLMPQLSAASFQYGKAPRPKHYRRQKTEKKTPSKQQ